MKAPSPLLQQCFDEVIKDAPKLLTRCLDAVIVTLLQTKKPNQEVVVADRRSLAWSSLMRLKPVWSQAYPHKLREAFACGTAAVVAAMHPDSAVLSGDTVVEQIKAWLGDGKFDLIVSDIAPNLSGIDSADQARSMHFLDLALDTVRLMLKPGAHFVAKMFQGQGSDEYVKELRKHFGKARPAAMMISAGLLDPRMKIEIEVTALKQR